MDPGVLQKLFEGVGGAAASIGGLIGTVLGAIASSSGCTQTFDEQTFTFEENCASSSVPDFWTALDVVPAGALGGVWGACLGLLVGLAIKWFDSH